MDWDLSEEEGEDDECGDTFVEASTLDPLDTAQAENLPPGELPSDCTHPEGGRNVYSANEDEDPRDEGPSTSVVPSVIMHPSPIPPSSPSSSPSQLISQATSQSPSSPANILPTPSFSQPIGPTTILPQSAKAVDFFMQFFDEDLIQHIVDQTNLYVQQNPLSTRYLWYDTIPNEIKAFIGLIIAMGIKRLPSYTDYWSSDPILGAPELVRGFPLNRFKHLLSNLHFNDNSKAIPRGTVGFDKLFKVRPIIDAIHQKCLRLYDPHQTNSIDEAMVGFKGRSTLKQYMPMKPTKRGFKIWCRCDSTNGYTCSFQVYTGKVEGATEVNLGSRVVLVMSETILDQGYHLYFDNFFSCPDLALKLLERKTYSIATARTNRKHFPRELQPAASALPRGQHVSSLVFDGKVQCLVWKDKKAVAFINTICDPNETTTVARRNLDGSQTQVSCPSAVKHYNANMGGVDLADQKRKAYTCTKKSKKWYMRLFWYLIDIAIVNAHILEAESPNHSARPQKDFRVELASDLLSCHSSRKKRGRPSDASPSARYNERHFPVELTSTRQCHVCSAKSARKRTKYGCMSCSENGIHLCPVPCFGIYHTCK